MATPNQRDEASVPATLRAAMRIASMVSVAMCCAPALVAAQSASTDLAEVVERAMPSVVALRAFVLAPDRRLPEAASEADELFKRLGVSSARAASRRENLAIGSGVVIAADGYIATSTRLVANASSIEIELSDRRTFSPAVVGMDMVRGIAILKIPVAGLKPIVSGSANRLRPGERLVAIGSYFTVSRSVADGMVSAPDAVVDGRGPFIQATVPLVRGGDGATLLNLRGEMVGMGEVMDSSGVFAGLSHWISADLVQRVYQELRQSGKVTHGRIGVEVHDVSWDEHPGLLPKIQRGALVGTVAPKGPGASAGLKVDDIIVRFRGVEVESDSHLVTLAREARPGERVELMVLRQGREIPLPVTIGE